MGENGITRPVVIEIGDETRRLCDEYNVPTDRIEFVSLPEGDELTEYAEQYAQRRGTSTETAGAILQEPLVYGGLLVHLGAVDGIVAGAAHPTADVVGVANGIVGLEPGIDTASSYFAMIFDDVSVGENGVLLYADCGVNIDPTEEQLADIAVSTAKTAQSLFEWSPRVAMLSFSTMGSAKHKAAETVSKATKRVEDRTADSNVQVIGEVQADTALDPAVAKRKLSDKHGVTGNANVLIFPDLNSGNIAYKLTQKLAGAKALGPILQGYARPVSDLSRGASAEDIVNIATITAVNAAQNHDGAGSIIQRGLLQRRESAYKDAEGSSSISN